MTEPPALGPAAALGLTVRRFVWRERAKRPPWQAMGFEALRLVWAVGRDMTSGQLTLRAMSLVYTTLLSLVPLLAISFSILKGFGVHNQIEPFLYNAMEPLGERRDEIVAGIIGFVDNVQVGVLGSVGFLLLFYTVVSLMQKIEQAFNEVWQISRRRSLTERFRDYLSVIIVGPVLVFSSLGITATVMSDPLMASVTDVPVVGWMLSMLGRLVPITMVVLAFTFIYMFVPYTRVRVLPAFTGGLIAGILWNSLGLVFAWFVAQANRYTAIYSGFATPILFMIWLYVGWLILLIGATIAFYRQNPEYLAGRQLTSQFSAADRDRLALGAAYLIGRHFYHGQPPPSAEALARVLEVPVDAVEQALDPLELRGLVAITADAPPGYLPGCPWEQASVHDVLDASRRANRTGISDSPPGVALAQVDAVLARQARVAEETFGGVTLKAFTTDAPAAVS
ncbi:MAG: YihY/virulence factor BrkB family protein [Pseudomonadales bacterium]